MPDSPASTSPRESESDGPAAPQPLFLHIGLPKSGTTFLQGLLATHRGALKQAGFIYPFVRREGMFYAAVELRNMYAKWGLEPEQIDGTWERLLGRARTFDGPAIISHELLAGAGEKAISRVAETTLDFELHIVITVRDLARQSVAAWQEQVKNGRAVSFAQFRFDVADHVDDPAQAVDSGGFWRTQDLGGVLSEWGAIVPPERLHVVVVPPAGAPVDELWVRFCDAVGLPTSAASPADVPRSNASLGVGQIALLRQINDALGDRLGQPHYAHVVKRYFAQRLLAQIPDTRRPVTPPDLAARFDAMVDRWQTLITERGYAVHGHLDDLRVRGREPGPPEVGDTPHPDDVTDAELVAGLPEVLASMLVEIADLRSQITGQRRLPPLEEGHPLRRGQTGDPETDARPG